MLDSVDPRVLVPEHPASARVQTNAGIIARAKVDLDLLQDSILVSIARLVKEFYSITANARRVILPKGRWRRDSHNHHAFGTKFAIALRCPFSST